MIELPRATSARTLSGTSALLGGGASVEADELAAAIAALSAAGPSSRALSRLEDLRDALSDLAEETKVRRAR
jgi:HAMP domain-containing protein